MTVHLKAQTGYTTDVTVVLLSLLAVGGREPKVIKYFGVKQATKQGFIECREGGVADLSYPTSKLRRGRVQDQGNVSPTITTTTGVCRIMIDDYLYKGFGVFKLTPRECLRLMNVEDRDIDKMMEVNSNTQCYKQAGNSIVVAVLCAIFSQLNIQGIKPWNDRTSDERTDLFDIRGREEGNGKV